MEVGFGITYKALTIELGQHFISPEFIGARSYSWGEINIKVTY
jgi:hypothetical protein